jgi:beta-glucosidase
VLLVNKNRALPLASSITHLVVGGKAADDIGLQSGGWTIAWQGASGNTTPGTTVLAAMRKALPAATIAHAPAGEVAKGAQAAVIVIGEQPYAEFKGDREDLSLAPEDVQAVKTAKKAGVPVIVVLFSGRPLILEPILADADALIAAWLPGTEGDGIADVLVGKFNPTGKLPVTWPRSMRDVPINVGPKGQKPTSGALFEYGFGLRYP